MSDNNNININTPDIGPYTHLQPFRFWCQKVLPLVYDESLSYYELLCKVVDYLNKTMEDVDQMITDMGDFQTAYTEFTTETRDAYIAFSREVSQAVEGLETFVNNYFNNLNVQTEINNKLDAMAEAGYFDTLFTTLFTDDIITEAGNVTSAWIAANLLQETGYVIDNSLTVPNAAADAARVGNDVSILKALWEENLFNDYKIYSAVGMSNGTATNPYNADCVYTTNEMEVKNGAICHLITDLTPETDTRFVYGVYGYNASHTIIYDAGPTARKDLTDEFIVTNPNIKYIRYAIGQMSENDTYVPLRVTDLSGHYVNIVLTYPNDIENELDKTNADIKATQKGLELVDVLLFDNLEIKNGTPPNPYNATCVFTSPKVPVTLGDEMHFYTNRPLPAGHRYVFGVYGYDSADAYLVQLGPADRLSPDLSDVYVIENANIVSFQYAIGEVDSSNNFITIRKTDFEDYICRIIKNEKTDAIYNQSYNGEKIRTKMSKYLCKSTTIHPPSVADVGDVGATQAFGIYDGKIFQYYSGTTPKLVILNMSDNSVIATLSAPCGHGNSFQFTDYFYSEEDDYPIALISDGLNTTIYKVRITNSAVTVLNTYTLTAAQVGAWCNGCVDSLNEIVYLVSYYQESSTDPTDNYMIVSKLNYNDLSFIESFTLPYIPVVQGCHFYDGKIYVLSSYPPNVNTKVTIINPGEKRITAIISDFSNTLNSYENEGIYFAPENDKMVAYIKSTTSNGYYYKMEFAD